MAIRSLFLAASAALLIVLAGCESSEIVPDTAMLGLDLEPVVGDQAYTPSQVYTVNGRAMTFASMRVYLSDLRLVRDDGTEFRLTAETPVTLPADDGGTTVPHTVNEVVVYAPLDAGRYETALAEVPAGHYHAVRFNVGLAGLTNHVDITQAPVGSALGAQDLGNFWSWSAGYIFLRTEGRVDGDGDGDVDGAEDADWNIHLGTDGYLMPVELEEEFEVAAGTAPALHFQLDLAHLLEGVDLGDPAQRVCHTGNNVPVANAVKGEAAHAFHFHGLHDHP